jgi:hypothetical protein
MHPHVASCAFSPIDRFFSVFRWTLPIYGALHFVPMLLFKCEAVVRAPKAIALRVGWGTLRSASFLGAMCAVCQGKPTPASRKLQRWDADMRGWAARVLLRCAELASGARGTETCSCVAVGRARIQGLVLARRLSRGYLGDHRSETSAWGTCDVCAPEGP